jgi:hypothetical protein
LFAARSAVRLLKVDESFRFAMTARAEKQRAWAEEHKSNGSKPGNGNRQNVGDRQADPDF